MKRILLLTLGIVFLFVGLSAVVLASQGGNEFDKMVGAIEHRYHQHGAHIPFMGVVSAIARVGSKGSVGYVNVVTFEDFKGQVDGAELTALVEQQLGSSWKRMIRETHPGGSDQTLIYARPEGKRMGLVVIDLDGKELDLVTVSVDPKHLQEQLAQHTHNSHADESDKSEEKEETSQQPISTATE